MPRLLQELSAAEIEDRAAESAPPTLDDVFLNLTGRSLREQVAAESDPAPGGAAGASNAKVSA